MKIMSWWAHLLAVAVTCSALSGAELRNVHFSVEVDGKRFSCFALGAYAQQPEGEKLEKHTAMMIAELPGQNNSHAGSAMNVKVAFGRSEGTTIVTYGDRRELLVGSNTLLYYDQMTDTVVVLMNDFSLRGFDPSPRSFVDELRERLADYFSKRTASG